MSTGQNSDQDSLPLEALAQIHDICNEFEQAFRADASPRIEDYLVKLTASATSRSALLLALLDIELELRRARGDRPTTEEYLARFPDAAATIATAFGDVPTRTLHPEGSSDLRFDVGDPVLQTAAARAAAATTDGRSDSPFDSTSTTVGNRTSPGNRFRILERIKEGGMGIISKAADDELHRTVALKEIGKRYASDHLGRLRFVVEAEITGALEHPSIVPVYGLGSYPDGRPFYAMRLMADRTLRDAITDFHARSASSPRQTRHDLDFRELLGRFLNVCDAIDYAHHRGILHRDLKPSNVMLGRFGETLVVDWGLAKLIDQVADTDARQIEPTLRPQSVTEEWRTWSGATHGTIGFMPPEQARGQDARIGPRSDVYALGAILYNILTGAPSIAPANRETTEDEQQDLPRAIDDIIAGRFPRPRARNPDISPALEAVCLKAMAIAPDDRYSSVRELADEVKHWLADEPVGTHRESRSERLARWTRRHRAQAQAAAAALLLVALVSSLAAAIVARVLHNENVARSAEHAARMQSDDNFAKARAAVRELVELAGNRLAYVNGSEDVRKQLAQKALATSREFLESQPHDSNVRLDMAKVLRVTANIGRMIGQFEEPLPLYQEATGLLELLMKESPSNPQIREEAVSNTIDTGELYAMNGLPERSRSVAQKALDLVDAPDAPFAEPASRNRLRAIAFLNLANAQNDSGRYPDARASGTRAIELLSAPGAAPGDEPINQLLLVMARANLGFTEHELGNSTEALRHCDLAIAGASALDAKYSSPDIKRVYAAVLNHRGELLADDVNRRSEAMTAFENAKRIMVALANSYPGIPQFRREVAVACNGRGGMLLALALAQTASNPREATGLLARARADCETSERLLRDLLKARPIFDYHSHHARTLANLARIESARGNRDAASALFEQAAQAHSLAIAANPDSQLDHKLLKIVDAERANLK